VGSDRVDHTVTGGTDRVDHAVAAGTDRVDVGGRLPAGLYTSETRQNRPVGRNAVATTVKQLSVSTQRRIGPLSAEAGRGTRAG